MKRTIRSSKKRRSMLSTRSELLELDLEKENERPAKNNRRKSLLRRQSLEPATKLKHDSMGEKMKRKRSKRVSFGAADMRIYQRDLEIANNYKNIGEKPIIFEDNASEMTHDSNSVTSIESNEPASVADKPVAAAPSLKAFLSCSDSPPKPIEEEEELVATMPDTSEASMDMTVNHGSIQQDSNAPFGEEADTSEITMDFTANLSDILGPVSPLSKSFPAKSPVKITRGKYEGETGLVTHCTEKMINVALSSGSDVRLSSAVVELEVRAEQETATTTDPETITSELIESVAIPSMEEKEKVIAEPSEPVVAIVTAPATATENEAVVDVNDVEDEELTMEFTANHGSIISALNLGQLSTDIATVQETTEAIEAPVAVEAPVAFEAAPEVNKVKQEEEASESEVAETDMSADMEMTQDLGSIMLLNTFKAPEETTVEPTAEVGSKEPEVDILNDNTEDMDFTAILEANTSSSEPAADVNDVTEDMEFTNVHGSLSGLLKNNATKLPASPLPEVEVSVTENGDVQVDMDFTQMHGLILSNDTAPTEDNTQEMSFTQMHSVNLNTSENKTEDMEFTQAHGAVLVTQATQATAEVEDTTQDMSFTQMLGMDALNVTADDNNEDAVDMSMTQTHGAFVSTTATVTADATETTTDIANASQDMSFTQMFGSEDLDTTSEALDTTNNGTEEMEFTKMHNLDTSVNVTANEDNTEDMQFTQAHGGILSAALEANTSIDNENDQSVDLAEETMDITQNWGHIVKHLGGSTSPYAGANDDNNSEESEQVLEHGFQDVLFGASEEKTVDLPSRTKLSQLTQDMASIYEKILNGGSIDTEDFSKFSPAPALNLSADSDVSSVDISQDIETPSQETPVPSSAKRGFTEGEAQSSAKKARSEDEEKRPWNEVTSLADFLRVGGLQCLDDAYTHLRPKSRDSSFGQASNTDAEWPPQDLREMLEISAVDNIEVQELSEGCLSLVDVTAQIKPQLQSMEEWFDVNGANIFNTFSTASPEVLEVEKEKLNRLMEHSRLSAKLAWNIWRVNDTLGLRTKLENTLSMLQTDVEAITSLANRAKKLSEYEIARKQPKLLEAQQQVELQKTHIEELLTKRETLDTEKKSVNESVTKLSAERDTLSDRLAKTKEIVRTQKDAEKSLTLMQDQFHALKRCTEWRPRQAHTPNAGGSFCLEFGPNGNASYVLTGLHDDQGRMVSTPTIKTTLLDKFLIGLFNKAKPALDKCLQKLETSSDITAVAEALSTQLGRLEDIRKEMNAMKESVTLQFLSKPGAMRVLVTSEDGYAQAVLSCTISPAYPFAPLHVRIKVNHLTEESANEHKGLGKNMLHEVKAVSGYKRLTRMVQKVSQML